MNLSTFLVAAMVAAICIGIVARTVYNIKKGKSACGGNCGSCGGGCQH